MYKLKKGVKNDLFDGDEDELEDHNVNLRNYHWEELDKIAEEKDVSRNQVMRDIVDQYFAIKGLLDFRSIEEALEDVISKTELILDEVKDNEDPVSEVSGIPIKGWDGGSASPEVAKIMNEAGNDGRKGIERGRVETITGKSEKPATRIMRTIAEEFEQMKFKKGDNKGPSKLFHKDHL
jgi:hypothetical protein